MASAIGVHDLQLLNPYGGARLTAPINIYDGSGAGGAGVIVATIDTLGAITGLGASSFTAPNGSGSGVAGGNLSFTTGTGGGGNSNGGRFLVTLGDGTGTGIPGKVTVSGTFTEPSTQVGTTSALEIFNTISPTGASPTPHQQVYGYLNVAGAGANYTGIYEASGEFWVENNATGALGLGGLWGAEGTVLQNTTGTLPKATGLQGNLFSSTANGTPGTVAAGQCVVAGIGMQDGTWTVVAGFSVAQQTQVTAIVGNIRGLVIPALYNDTNGASTTGGYLAYGINMQLPVQGGNTSGTNQNFGLAISGAGGVPGAGGTVNNFGIQIAANTAAASQNVGLQILGIGSAASSLGGQANRAIQAIIPLGGGNTSGTVTNIGAYISNNGGGNGSAGAGGTVNTTGLYIEVPNGAAGAGSTTNYGVQIIGNGGTATNRAIFCSSTAASVFAGPITIGSTSTPTATSLTFADAWNIVVNTATGTQIATSTTQKLGFWGKAPVVQQTFGATITNNVTAGGTANQLDNFTSLTVYATDAAAIRNDIYQLGQSLKTVVDALRLTGILS